MVTKDKPKPSKEAYDEGLPKDDKAVDYLSISTTEGQFCGNCRFYNGYGNSYYGTCSPVEGEVAQEGTCNLWREIEVIPVPIDGVIYEGTEGYHNAEVGQSKKKKPTKIKESKVIYESISSFIEAKDKTGKEWKIKIITEGKSGNGINYYSEEALHASTEVFNDIPVHAAIGADHSQFERGVNSIVGIVKDPVAVDGGIEGTFHVSSPELQATLLDLDKEGVLESLMGFSIVADGEWKSNLDGTRELIKFTAADSVDLVRNPAAGGKFIKVTESKDGDGVVTELTEDRVGEIISEKLGGFKDELLAAMKPSDDEETEEAKHLKKVADDKAKAEKDGDDDPDSDAAKKKAKAKEALGQEDASPMELRMFKQYLAMKIQEAKLPETVANKLVDSFGNVIISDAKIQEAIKGEKDYLASIEKTVTESLTRESGLGNRVIADEGDKMLARMDAMFDVVPDKDGNGGHQGGVIDFKNSEGNIERIQAYGSFKEAYCRFTGENPLDVSGVDLWRSIAGGMNGYDSADEKRRKKTYEALAQSDWSNVIIDRLHNAMLKNYDNLPQYQDWKKVASVIPVSDFQPWRDTKIGGYSNLAVVVEKGVYPDLTHPGDEQTSATLAKHGGIAAQITRELIINDQIGAIAQIPVELARAAARTLYEAVFDMIASSTGATYGPDSTVLYHSNHNNINTVALDMEAVNGADILMRTQTKYGSTADVLGGANTAKYILVPNELRGLATRIANPSGQWYYSSTNDTTEDDDPTRWSGKLEVITLDYLTQAARWFLAADPNQVAGIGVLFMGGRQEPELFVQNDERVGEMFTMDVQNIKVRHEWQTVLRDYRPFFGSTA